MSRSVCPVLLALLLAGAGTASGQGETTEPQFIDKIIAIVGNTPILASQVEEQILMATSNGAKVPDDSAGRVAMRRQVLDNMIDEELLVQQASRDTSIRLTEQEIQDQVEKTVTNVRRQFTNELDFETQLRAAGFASEEEWRRWLADTQRRTIQQQRLIESLRTRGKLRPIPPTDEQMREYWDESAAQRPKHPPLVSFRQIVIVVQPDPAAVTRTRALAESLKVALRAGASFVEVARGFSADSATRSQGGELGWFRRGVMVKAFEDAAFRLRPGQISEVVQSPFGYHIIQVERIEPAEIQARHILLQPRILPPQVEIARQIADSIGRALTNGAHFDTYQRLYSDPEEPPLRESVPIGELHADYIKAIGKDTVPGVVPAFEIDANTARPRFVLLEITKWEPEGDLKFEDVKERLRTQVGQQLAIKAYIANLRRTSYVAFYP
jgi:peptidyl-prolyl cis-trans isomerase SurA